MNMWNFLDLECPSKDLCEYVSQDNDTENLRDFVTVLTTAADTLTSEQSLYKELYILRNVQAKYKRILHCDKCLQYLHRVTYCLRKMVLLNLSKSYLDLAERFLIGFQELHSNIKLPSRQQVEYILIRTQSAAKLVCEGIRYSRETFCFVIQKLKVGHLLIDLVMAASVTARLNIMLKTILVQLYDVYKKILPWHRKLKQGSFQWKEKLNLPKDLKIWLEASESGLMKPFPMSKADADFLSNIIKKKNNNIESDSDSIILVDKADEDCQVVEDISHTRLLENTDYGEVIPRQENNKKLKKNLTPWQEKFLCRIVQVQTFEELETVWRESLPKHFPKTLSSKKKATISSYLNNIKQKKQQNVSKSKKKPNSDANLAGVMLAQHLGFTQERIDMCMNNIASCSSDVSLEPVKNLKSLKIQYKQLCRMLQMSNQTQKCHKLKEIYQQRVDDIKLLKQNGDKVIAKKLILCTSKVLLTLYQKLP